ncbi:hypothetical protein HanIR_Chr08g0373741 [Helianthus annuus]|nr:hypothetical protein HanIR_Chr08g0373741 [Helianthus annuus]
MPNRGGVLPNWGVPPIRRWVKSVGEMGVDAPKRGEERERREGDLVQSQAFLFFFFFFKKKTQFT